MGALANMGASYLPCLHPRLYDGASETDLSDLGAAANRAAGYAICSIGNIGYAVSNSRVNTGIHKRSLFGKSY